MWIAKPLQALSEMEREDWQSALGALEAAGLEVPLSQTLAWAEGVQAVSGRVWLVFSPDEGVGGVVFATGAGGFFECVNGPLLNWGDPQRAPRQLATFAMAVSKLARSAGLGGLIMKPRWESSCARGWLGHLPIPPSTRDRAATIQVPLTGTATTQFQLLRPRFRRSLARAQRLQEEVEWRAATPEAFREFVPRLKKFGEKKGFTVPPPEWFDALVRGATNRKGEGLSFWLSFSKVQLTPELWATSQILLCFTRKRAHYLFGMEDRSPACASSNQRVGALSPAALSHWLAMVRCLESGLTVYDLNGYVVHAPREHPYAGVCRFKDQFGGDVVEYETPEFRVEF